MEEIVIRPTSKWHLLDFKELWLYRELLYVFAWRDIKVRYKQTILGILWVVFQPFVSMIIFTFFFGRLAKIPSNNLPYSLFVLCGLVYWTFFSGSLTHISNSMITNQQIIKKVYFPKIILPCASVIQNLFDFIINFALLIIFGLILGYVPQTSVIIIFPVTIIISSLTILGIGFLFSSLNVKYRDIFYVLPFFIQLLLFLTPVIYPLSVMSERNQLIMSINPMSFVIEATRSMFSGQITISPIAIVISVSSSIILFIVGLWYFKKTQIFFSDIV